MGVNYDQKCMIGLRVDIDDIKVVISEAVYEDQNRYDSRTGKVTHVEKVLVEEERSRYEFMGEAHGEWEVLGYNVARKLKLQCYTEYGYYDQDKFFCIGEFIGESDDCGNVDLLSGELSLSEISEIFERVGNILGPVSLHFLNSVG